MLTDNTLHFDWLLVPLTFKFIFATIVYSAVEFNFYNALTFLFTTTNFIMIYLTVNRIL